MSALAHRDPDAVVSPLLGREGLRRRDLDLAAIGHAAEILGAMPPRVRRIVVDVARAAGIRIEQLLSRSKVHVIVHARQEAMAQAWRPGVSAASSHQVGKWFGGYHNSTVIHARNAVAKRRAAAPELLTWSVPEEEAA